MKKRSWLIVIGWMLLGVGPVFSQVKQRFVIPDLPEYLTLKCDFHMHTVFSDGQVWPTVRVDEAWRQDLNAISITDHIEYQPHKKDVSTNHNRPYETAAGRAKERDVLLIRGAEITRDTPPGHFNAIFLKDINPLEVEDFVESIKRANEQGGFVFWNHQAWKGEEKGRWREVHTTIFKNKWLHGMEVCNGNTYYPSAHRWCLEKNMTMMGNTDIHDPDLRTRSTGQDHRTMTLVFAKERTTAGVKEALQAGRTAVWFGRQVIGREPYLKPLFGACIEVKPIHHRYKNTVWAEVTNRSDLELELTQMGSGGPKEVFLPGRHTIILKAISNDKSKNVVLSYRVANFLVRPGEGLVVTLVIPQK